ncbi:putative baseplate assembly protein [Methanosarcina sp. WWM596]|uniref:putative baseplate assembly protein n=1 Tax=Methanosarcina sp. WWM596 TaxID=1434103 RepID=UPI000615AA41|nr:putative baseplate assembly protein [Methanosarcina sp. WWM596]AKB18672.1 hypothetical protein MSWHS_1809 [Methanosarcina sp. WWM596]
MPLPKENLDNKAFDDLVKDSISRIPIYAPGWTDYNVHDPGITFIELFSWLTEMQIYRLNRINDKNYRKYLKLIGIPKLKPASAAKVDVTFSLRPGVTQADVPKGTIVVATYPVTGENIFFRIEQDLKVVNTEITVLSREVNTHEVYIKTNKKDDVCQYEFRPDEQLKEGDELYIGFKDYPNKEIVLKFYFQVEEPFKKEDSSFLVPSGTLSWEYFSVDGKWHSIEEIVDSTALSGMVNIKIVNGMKKTKVSGKDLFWLRCKINENGNSILPKIDHVLLNKDLKVNDITVLSRNAGDIYINNTEVNKNDNLYYHAFRTGEQPEEGDELYIGFEDNPFKYNLEKEIVLAFYLQDDEPLADEENTVLVPSGTLNWEYYGANETPDTNEWNTIEDGGVTDGTRNLTVSGKVRIKIDKELKEKDIGETKGFFWLRCSVKDKNGYYIPPKIDRVLLNTVSAVNAIPYNEVKFSSSGLPGFYIDLEHVPVLDATEPDKRLTVNKDENWTEVKDFDASKPGDQHYTVNFASGRVTFGNGINGKIPPKGTDNIRVSYCSGGGVRGNVKAGAITRILDGSLDERVTVINIEAASCGTEAETLEEAIQRARNELKKVTRAVTSADYEYLALNTPGLRVARAKALPRYHPSQDREVPGIISIIVVPESPFNNPIPSENFLKAVYRHLDEHRLLTTELFVLQPVYVEISVKAEVVVKPKNLTAQVKKAIENKLEKFLHPVSGGFDGKGLPFGRSVYLSEIYELIDGVEGVDYVVSVTLRGIRKTEKESLDIPPTATRSISIPAEGLVYLDLVKTKIVAREET